MNRPGIATFVSLPDIFTILNGTLGFFAIYSILIGEALLASRIVFLCIFFDSFDGFLARRNNNCAEFGRSLDSLSDIISFGIVPSFIFISYGNNNLLGSIVRGNLCYIGIITAFTIQCIKFRRVFWPSYYYWGNLCDFNFSSRNSFLFIFYITNYDICSFYLKF